MKHKLQITITGKAGTGRTSMGILLFNALQKAGIDNVAFESIDCDVDKFERITEMLEDGTKDAWKSMIDVRIIEVQAART